MKYEKIQLPYAYNALEPYIDAETMEVHYSKHHQTYVNNLNNLLEGHNDLTEGKSIEDLLSNLDSIPENIRQGVINQGGGVVNHNIYFSILSPNPNKEPKGRLLEKINKTFGSLDNLKKELSDLAVSQFGSGFAWLAKDKDGNLKTLKTLNQDNPLSLGLTPILGIDVWEHAYYLKYKNLRPEYVRNIWNVIDWSKVEELYLK